MSTTPQGEGAKAKVIAMLLVLIVIGLVIDAVDGDDESVSERKASSSTTAAPLDGPRALATLDGRDDVASYRRPFETVRLSCRNGGEEDLSDLIVHTRNVLKDNGRTFTHAQVLIGMEQSTAGIASQAQLRCEEVATAWATLVLGP